MTVAAAGAILEGIAAEYLQRQQYQILDRNFRCRYGEIDIIARQHDCLIFVEVRFRNNNAYSTAEESVNITKQNKIIKTAECYLEENTCLQDLACRFDVLALSKSKQSPHIEWIKDAFDA